MFCSSQRLIVVVLVCGLVFGGEICGVWSSVVRVLFVWFVRCMLCVVLCCVVLCCVELCCVVLLCVVLCCVALCCVVLWCVVLCCVVLC